MPVDILGALTPGLTFPLLASGSGAGIDLGAGGSAPAGTALYGLVARVLVSTASNATGSRTLRFPIDHSTDNTNWVTLAGAGLGLNDDLTRSTTAESRENFLWVMTHQRYIRLT